MVKVPCQCDIGKKERQAGNVQDRECDVVTSHVGRGCRRLGGLFRDLTMLVLGTTYYPAVSLVYICVSCMCVCVCGGLEKRQAEA